MFVKNISEIVHRVTTLVCAEFGVTKREILNKRHQAHLVVPRRIVMYILRKRYRLSFPVIGTFLDKDHSTVIYAVRKAEKQVRDDPAYCDCVYALIGKLDLGEAAALSQSAFLGGGI
jgi:chromosomal replication initiation ATPase DnaA